MKHSSSNILGVCAALIWLSGCTRASAPQAGATATPNSETAAVQVDCASGGSATTSVWMCPAPFSVDCEDLDDTSFTVQSPSGQDCSPDQLELTHADPLIPGTHTLELHDASGATLCTTALTVVSATPPTLEPHVIQLWPPNHKFHDISIDDCVTVSDSCGEQLQAEFIWASSDEPIDDIGDGHHAPDIMLGADCQHVAVRSERQGPKDGRVYKLGVRVVDRSGNASEAVCHVIVDHDQRGVVGADSGEAYRLLFDGMQGGLSCDGTQPPMTQPPVTQPPATQPPKTQPPVTPPLDMPPPIDTPQ